MANLSLRWLLCLTFALPVNVWAAAAKTQTGSGGAPPKGPTSPPTTYRGGDDGDSDKKGNEGPQPKRSAGKFGEIWGIGPGGKEIFFEGQLDQQGRQRVWSYATNKNFVRRGVIVPDSGHLDGRVQWRQGHTFYKNMLAELNGEVAKPLPAVSTPQTSPTEKPITGNLVDRIRVKSGDGQKLELAYFQGRKDLQGRERLFRPHVANGKPSLQFYQVGALNGLTAEWSAQVVSHDDLIKELEKNNVDERADWRAADRDLYRERLARLKSENLREWLSMTPDSRAQIPEAAKPTTVKVELPPPPAPKTPPSGLQPLDPSRSLVTTPAGNSSTNSPYLESVGTPKNLTAAGEAPVEVGKTLEWNKEKSKRVGRWVQKIRSGEYLFGPRTLNGRSPYDPVIEPEKNPRGSMNFTQNAFYFYTALGVAAAYTLMMQYPNNPMAWNAYLDTLTDPIGYLSFAGFIVAAAPFFRRIEGASTMGQIPLFASALVAGSLASTAISVYANDPNFKACAGFASYAIHGQFNRSTEACQALFNKWTATSYHSEMLEEISIRFVPMATNVAITGTLFLGGIQGVRFLVNRSAWITALRTLAVAKTPRTSGLGTVAMTVGQFALFLGAYQLTDMVFETEKGTREGLLAGDGFLSGPYSYLFGDANGTSINDAENKIFSEWQRLKKARFADPASWDKVCIDKRRKDSILYDCDRPDAVDFEKSLNRYGKLLGSWRATQMKPTMNAFKDWNAKSNDFNVMLGASYNFYKKSLQQIQGVNGAKPFTAENLKLNLSGQEILIAGQEKTWKYVSTPRVEEFLLTSMACGPELEGVGVTSTWDRVRQLSKSWITGNTRPDSMIADRAGRALVFYPPRITKQLSETRDTVCENRDSKWLFGVLPPLPNPMDAISPMPSNTKTFGFYVGDKYYRGLTDYVKENIRESVWAGGFQADTFDTWWNENVIPSARRVRDELRQDYKKMLESTYKPAVSRRDYYWCESGATTSSGLDKYLRLLDSAMSDCAAVKLHRLAYGPLDGLRDELRLYLAFNLDLLFSERGLVAADPQNLQDNDAINLVKALLASFDEVLARFKELDPGGRRDIFDVRDQFATHLAEFQALFAKAGEPVYISREPQPAQAGAQFLGLPKPQGYIMQPKYALRLADLLNGKIGALFEDATNYFNVLAKFDNAEWPAMSSQNSAQP